MSDAPPDVTPDVTPDVEEIRRIARDIRDGADVVNRRITHAYHRLSEGIRRELDAGPNLDWCGLAKWSSYTIGLDLDPDLVGADIENLAELIESYLPFLGLVHAQVIDLLQGAFAVEDGLVVKALRGGNAAIFSQLGAVFARLLERLPERRAPNTVSDREFAEQVVAEILGSVGRKVVAPITHDMLGTPEPELLVRGIELYLRAAADPEHRAELMLAGNMLFSVYEQTRADRLITIGLCAPVRSRLVPLLPWLGVHDVTPSDVLLAGPGETPDVVRWIEDGVVSRLTKDVMVVLIGDHEVRLGRPERLPPPVIVPTLPDVEAILDEQRRRAVGHDRIWTDLNYRLGFIARYFAAFGQDPAAAREPPATD